MTCCDITVTAATDTISNKGTNKDFTAVVFEEEEV